ncbi:MAG: hypothetical protein HY548_09890 [Elusimicrobia bacterium]|nr:hypothetical protein [Elusimicrobiota bacterium]
MPRQKLVAAPYALAVATSSVGTNEIIDGSIGLNDLNPGYPGCSNGEIPKISGGVWTCQADGGATYTADESGITLVGSQFRLELYGTTLASDANGLRVNAIGTTEITNDAIRGEDLDKGDVKLKAGSDGKYYSTYAPD